MTLKISICLFLFPLFQTYGQNFQPEMIEVEGGTFLMGTNNKYLPDETPAHTVSLSNFSISKYEITKELFSAFCNDNGTQTPPGDPNFPATFVSWYYAIMFCNWLSDMNSLEHFYTIQEANKSIMVKLNKTANGYRLPTEAEWEYAARGGNKSQGTIYSGGDDPLFIAWYFSLASVLHNVGEKQPNELGLYDMSGGVAEWCFDYYDNTYYKTSPKENPFGPEIGTSRVVRGGHFLSQLEEITVSHRAGMEPQMEERTQGFRVVKNN